MNRKLLQKSFIFIMALCMSVFAFTACGKEQKAESDGKEAKKNVTLTFGSHQSGLPTSGVVQELAKEFEAETGIKIDFQISPDAQWRDLIKVKLDSGEAPDIFCADTPINLASSMKFDEYCVPLNDEEWVSRIDENVLPAISIDDNVYGITFPGKKMYFYLYNKEIFDRLGLEAPTNYEEFKKVCQTILDAGITPVFEATTNGWHQVLPLFETGGLYQQKHPDLYNKLNANEMDLNDIPELLTIIQQLKECAELGYFGKDYLSNSVENAKEAIATEKAAMFIAEAAWRNELKADYPDFDIDKLGIFVMPWGDNQVIGVNPASNAYFINKESKHIDEARQFFEFLARPENLKKRLDGQPGLSEVCWPEIPGRYSEEDQAYIDAHDKAQVVQVAVNYIDSQWMDVGKDLESMYTDALTPEGVLDVIMNRRQEQAKLQKDPAWTK
jgi:raffinose/stachyose/melibiose transport system substrate-binding protein